MGHQCYIQCDNYYLAACVYLPERYDKVVILLQGYSHSMTDVDYFMTNIKNELLKKGCAVIQFDPSGHGDSDGKIENFDYDTMIKNLQSVIAWSIKNFNCSIYFVTRGLYELSIYNTEIKNCFDKCIILNPVAFNKDEYYNIKELIGEPNKIIDFNEWFNTIPDTKKDAVESIFYSMGAKLKNLQGQYFNTGLLQDFISRLFKREACINANSYYIFSNSVENYSLLNDCRYPTQYSVSYYFKYGALPRDPVWHYNIINNIVALCTEN